MTYDKLISLISTEAALPEIYADPPSSDPDVLADQVRRAYIAVLVVAGDIPLHRLPVENEPLNTAFVTDNLLRAELPDALFRERGDKGIHEFIVDNKPYTGDFYPLELTMQSWNTFQESNPHISLDGPAARAVYFSNGTDINIRFVERPLEPVPDGGVNDPLDYTNLDIPLQGKDIETAVQLAASHITGIKSGDAAMARLHLTYSQLYNNKS